jgi:hypothetical protein
VDWWDSIGNMTDFLGDTPALAVDMALHGANPDYVGYDLAFGLQAAQTPIDVYPSETASVGPEV